MADNDEAVIVFEGNPFEALKIKSLLEDNGIEVITNSDLQGGFDNNLIAQLLVFQHNKDTALKIINDCNDNK